MAESSVGRSAVGHCTLAPEVELTAEPETLSSSRSLVPRRVLFGANCWDRSIVKTLSLLPSLLYWSCYSLSYRRLLSIPVDALSDLVAPRWRHAINGLFLL